MNFYPILNEGEQPYIYHEGSSRNIKWKSKLGKGIRIEIKVRLWPLNQYWTKVSNHRYHEGSWRNIMIINIKWKSKLGKGIRIEIKVRPWPFTQYWMKVRNHIYHEGSSRNIMNLLALTA